MKATVCTKYGSSDVLQIKEVDKPTPGDDEVLVKIHATTVNRTDSAYIRAIPFIIGRLMTGLFRPKNPIPGTEFAGKIESIGKNVSSFKVGDRVFGFTETNFGAQAQYMTISEGAALTTIPDDLAYEQAAASSEGAFYALNFLNKVKIESGQKVLVNGATGAIGSATVQFLKYHGVDVTAVCNTKNMELVRSLGANRVIDYTKDDFTKEEFAKDDERYNYVFDTVGKSSFGKCKPLLQPGGVYISSDLGYMAQNLFLPLFTKIGNKKVKFPIPADCKGCVLFVKELIEKGKFKAVIDRKYPLEEIVEAYKYVEKGQKTGNVVITVEHGDKTSNAEDESSNAGDNS